MARPFRWTPPRTPFTLAHVTPLGVTSDMLRASEGSGRIARLSRGVYIATEALATDPVAAHLQRALAVQLRTPRGVASHGTAALAHGLALDDPLAVAGGPARFTVAPARTARAIRTHEARTSVRPLPTGHRTAHPSGLVVTSLPRTAVDVAAESPLPAALVVLDSAARTDLISRVGERGLRRAYADERLLARAREPFVDAARVSASLRTRRWLEEVVPLADPRREAPSESLSYALFVAAGLPLPELQVPIDTGSGLVYPDFLWAAQRVIGEVDGKVKYTDPEVLHAEKVRQDGLERLGYLVVRWMAHEVGNRPAAVVGRVWQALTVRGLEA